MANPKTENKKTKVEEDLDDSLPSVISFSEDLETAEPVPPLPAGDYIAEIRNVEAKDSQRGTKYAAVSFMITPDQYPADYEGNPDGELLIYRRVMLDDNPRNRFALKTFIQNIGATLGKRVDLNSWIGLRARVTLKHTTYEGTTRAEIDRVNAV